LKTIPYQIISEFGRLHSVTDPEPFFERRLRQTVVLLSSGKWR